MSRSRTPLVVWLGLAAMAASLFLLLVPLKAAAAERWIIDTDMGIDDWAAVLFMSHKPDDQIMAITASGNGLSRCQAGERNAHRILRLAADREPVGCSNDYPMDGTNAYPTQWRDLSDRLLDIPIPTTPGRFEKRSATALMKKTLRKSKRPVSILSLGAMTNIAEVIHENPSLTKKIRRIVAMAGAVDVPGNIQVPGFTEDIPNTVAEWNVFIDPPAAKIVFDSAVPMEIIPLDATNKVPLTASFIKRFEAKTTGAESRFIARVFRNVSGSHAAGEYFHWDPLAAAIADRPKLCSKRERRKLTATSTATGPTAVPGFPVLNWFGTPRNQLDEVTAGGLTAEGATRSVAVCLRANVNGFERFMINAFAKPNS